MIVCRSLSAIDGQNGRLRSLRFDPERKRLARDSRLAGRYRHRGPFALTMHRFYDAFTTYRHAPLGLFPRFKDHSPLLVEH